MNSERCGGRRDRMIRLVGGKLQDQIDPRFRALDPNVRCPPRQFFVKGIGQGVASIPVKIAHAAEVARHMSFIQEVRKNGLRVEGRLPVKMRA